MYTVCMWFSCMHCYFCERWMEIKSSQFCMKYKFVSNALQSVKNESLYTWRIKKSTKGLFSSKKKKKRKKEDTQICNRCCNCL